jgi:poly-gamma-glutamate synthesis protein (capsule biosynthesis protein)
MNDPHEINTDVPSRTGKDIIILAVGDIMLGDSPVCYGFGVASLIDKFGPQYPFEYVQDELAAADIVIGNLEVVLSRFDRGKDSFTDIQFRGKPEAAKGLAAAGFDVLSVATNHTMQHGAKALLETLELLRRNNMKYIGVSVPSRKILPFCRVEKYGVNFCFLNYNLRPQQYFVDPPCWKTPDPQSIKNDIDEIRTETDIIVISFHWGDEFIDYPSPEQVRLARSLIDHGADIIIGHHPHILQGVEKYRHGVIAYSLGNFVFDMWQPRLRKSMMLRCTISPSMNIDYEIIPVLINKSHQPQILQGEQRRAGEIEIALLAEKITEEGTDRYYDAVGRNLKKFRREICLFYLTHLFRYRPKDIISNFLGAMKKRLRKSADILK